MITSHLLRRAAVPTAAVAVTTALLGGPAMAAGGVVGDAQDRATLAHVRDVTAKYRDVAVAIADGYRPTDACVSSPAGGMGLHYVNPALLGSLDPDRPSMLLYAADGEHRTLMGAEWFKADADQNLATDADRPSLFGHAFDGPMPGHQPGMPVHYDLHVWAWHANPAGDFTPWNPSVNC